MWATEIFTLGTNLSGGLRSLVKPTCTTVTYQVHGMQFLELSRHMSHQRLSTWNNNHIPYPLPQ